MDVWIQIGLGLLLLALGGDAVVRGAVGVARRLGVSELVVGLTLVGFGTSMPELLTSVNAALRGAEGVAVGNVIGSNISNALLIAGIAAVVRPIPVLRAGVLRDGSVMVAASLALVLYAAVFPVLERWAGAALFLLLLAYVGFSWRRESGGGEPSAERFGAEGLNHEPAPPALSVSLLIAGGGIGLLMVGADQLVQGAILLARSAGVSETLIGLTVVAVGTSLPELVATLAATVKGRPDVAFGNVVGSNIYNVLGVLGCTALVHPVAFPSDLVRADWAVFLGGTLLLVVHSATGTGISRREGGSLLFLYGLYLASLAGRSVA